MKNKTKQFIELQNTNASFFHDANIQYIFYSTKFFRDFFYFFSCVLGWYFLGWYCYV